MMARKKSLAEQAAEYSALAMALPVSTFIGWLLGHLLDKAFGTTYLSIAGLLLGIVAGFVEFLRQVTRDSRNKDD